MPDSHAPITSKHELGQRLGEYLAAADRKEFEVHGAPVDRSMLAAQAGISLSTLYAWLKGDYLPRWPNLERFLKAVRVPPAEWQAFKSACLNLRFRPSPEPAAEPRAVFTWRRSVNVFQATEADAEIRSFAARPDELYLAVRWRKNQGIAPLRDVHAEASLRAYGNAEFGYRVRQLEVVADYDGRLGPRRPWGQLITSMPFTLWIPLKAGLDEYGRLTAIQGHRITEEERCRLAVRLTGSSREGTVIEEHEYDLRKGVQYGPFVPVHPRNHPDQDLHIARWDGFEHCWTGWERFEEIAVNWVFAYGTLRNPLEQRALYGVEPGPGQVVPAVLDGWRLDWNVCTDNTVPDRPALYRLPGTQREPSIQVLFPNVVKDPGSQVVGDLLRVGAGHLPVLDAREGNYERHNVTDAILPQADGGPFDMIWTYVGLGEQIRRAKAGIAAGTARIRREYLDKLPSDIDPPPGIPVVSLDRVLRQRP